MIRPIPTVFSWKFPFLPSRTYTPGFARAVVDLLPHMQKEEKRVPFHIEPLMHRK